MERRQQWKYFIQFGITTGDMKSAALHIQFVYEEKTINLFRDKMEMRLL